MKLFQDRTAFSNPRHAAAAVTVGFSCMYSVAIVFFYCDWLYDIPGADPLMYGGALNAALCLAAVVLFWRSRTRPASDRVVAAVGTACFALALALVLAASMTGSLVCAYAAGAAAGAGAGLLAPVWFDRAGRLAGDRFAYVLGVASLVSAPVALVLDLLPDVLMVAACALFVAVSAALALTLGKLPSQSEPQEPRAEDTVAPSRSLAAPLAYVFLLSIAYGVLDVVAMASPTATAAESGFVSQAGSIAAIAVFLLYVRFGKGRYTALLNGSLAVIATGLVFLPFLGGGYSVVLVVLTHMGWETSLLVSYALVIELFRSDRRALLGWSAAVFAFPRPGMVLGWVAASLVSVGNQFAFAQMTIIAFALLYLIMMGVWMLRTREKRAAERALRKRDDLIKRYLRARDDLQALACDELAAAHNLTKRETEILRLLAQGRDAAHIEQTLFLSRNTVKSYSKSLYAKLGVHSKQEVIDLVNASMSLGEPVFKTQ